MKRTLIALLASLMVLSSVFAGGAAEQTASTQDVALGSQAVEITFWHSASDEAGVLMDKYIKTFNETNPYQIKVNAIYQGQYSDATTLMKTIISAENYKELPDIMQLDATGKVDYFNSGNAWTVDDAIKEMNDDISGDYNTYDNISSEAGVTMKGYGESFSNATWCRDGYTYSIMLSDPVSSDVLLFFTKQVI